MSHYSFRQLHLAQTELVVLQSTTLCNLDCSYCFLPERKLRNTLSLTNLEKIIRHLAHDRLLAETATVCWHLGEPTLLPPDYYRDAHAIVRSACPDTQFDFQMQTNGVRLDRDWCNLFIEESVSVGISIDGDARLNDRRVDWSGNESFARAVEGVNTLRQANVDFYAIAVLADAALLDPLLFYQFFKELGVKRLCLNVPESEGSAVSQFLLWDEIFDRLEEFYEKLWEISRSDRDPIWIRELHQWRYDTDLVDRDFAAREITHGKILTILSDGDVIPMTPDLATVRKDDLERFVIGNLIRQPLSIQRNNAACEYIDAVSSRVIALCRENCSYFGFCGGGSLGHRWAETRSFEQHETRTCRGSVQARVAGILRAKAGEAMHHTRDT